MQIIIATVSIFFGCCRLQAAVLHKVLQKLLDRTSQAVHENKFNFWQEKAGNARVDEGRSDTRRKKTDVVLGGR